MADDGKVYFHSELTDITEAEGGLAFTFKNTFRRKSDQKLLAKVVPWNQNDPNYSCVLWPENARIARQLSQLKEDTSYSLQAAGGKGDLAVWTITDMATGQVIEAAQGAPAPPPPGPPTQGAPWGQGPQAPAPQQAPPQQQPGSSSPSQPPAPWNGPAGAATPAPAHQNVHPTSTPSEQRYVDAMVQALLDGDRVLQAFKREAGYAADENTRAIGVSFFIQRMRDR